jgi:hypothetical protein
MSISSVLHRARTNRSVGHTALQHPPHILNTVASLSATPAPGIPTYNMIGASLCIVADPHRHSAAWGAASGCAGVGTSNARGCWRRGFNMEGETRSQ